MKYIAITLAIVAIIVGLKKLPQMMVIGGNEVPTIVLMSLVGIGLFGIIVLLRKSK